MSHAMFYAYSIELSLILLSSFFLIRYSHYGSEVTSKSWGAMFRWASLIAMGLLFCWSIVLGALLALQEAFFS